MVMMVAMAAPERAQNFRPSTAVGLLFVSYAYRVS
jgi:hypothetical protein